MYNPLVSIIIPTYNRAILIGETIQSVIDQTYTNWELIIIDDGSQDNTNQVITNFQDKRISYFTIEHCGIFGKVRNEGLKKVQGDYVAFLDSDDLWSVDKLETQMATLQKYPGAFFVFNNITIFGTRAFKSPPDYDELFVGNILLPMLEETRFVFYPSTLLFKKEAVINKVGLMNEELSYGTDTKYFLNICQHFDGVFLNKRLVRIRRHDQSTTEQYTSTDVFIDSINIASNIYKAGSITKSEYERIVGNYYYKMGLAELHSLKNPGRAATSFVKGVKFTPFQWKAYFRLLQSVLLSLKKIAN